MTYEEIQNNNGRNDRKMQKTDNIYIRVTPELKQQLQKAAEADNRTLSSYIETVLKRALSQS